MTSCQAQHRRAIGVRRVSRPAWSPPGRAGRCDCWGNGRPVCDLPETERQPARLGDADLDRQLDDADRHLRASVAGALDVEAGLAAIVEQPTDLPAAVPERGRLTVPGRRTDDGRACSLVVVNEADGSWSFSGPGEPGVRLTCDMVVVMADAILRRAR